MFTSCYSKEISLDPILPMEQKSLINYFEVIPSTNGFYYVDDQLILNYFDLTNLKNLSLGTLDEKTNMYTYSYMGSTIYQNHNFLWYLTDYTNAEGVAYSSVTRQSLDGMQVQNVFDLEYNAEQFLIHNGYFICIENKDNGEYIIHIHDATGKECAALEETAFVDHLFADGERIYYTTLVNENSVLKYIDCKDLTSHLVDIEFQTFIFENMNKISVYTCEKKTSNEDTVIHASLMDLDTNKPVFSVDNAVINYFDDTYIYTSSTKEESVTYRLYDWDGTLIKEISPEELLGKECHTNNMFWNTNGSQIIRIVDRYIVASSTRDKMDRFYICNIDSGKCSFVN